MLEEIKENWKLYCNKNCFIGIGSTRKAYRTSDYVIKIHLHPIGYHQSKNEHLIYQSMVKRGLDHLFAKVFYIDEKLAIQQYVEPVELMENQSYEIDLEKHREMIPNQYEETIQLLDRQFDSFDLKDSSNYGLNQEGRNEALYGYR